MPKINQEQAAKIIENGIIDSLKIKFKKFDPHPIRVIQASKSLIGLNLKNPNMKLLDFISIYMKEFDSSFYYSSFDYNKDLNEVISIRDLEEAFLIKDRKNILDMSYQLSLVSSESHILEYLVEISLKQTGKSFLFIWSLYRSILFISNKDSKLFLNLAIDAILSDEFTSLPNNDSRHKEDFESWHSRIIKLDCLSLEKLDLYSHLLEAYNSDLIRISKIKDLIKNLIFNSNKFECISHSSDGSFNDKYTHLLSKGRYWLLDFLNEQDKQTITPNLIIFLDSIRSLLRFSDKNDYKFICGQFEKWKILRGT